ncbi:MAG TPA: MaoC/PaaZ C-terminal domain-containing protein [Micromonosporaceae bacterium]
MIRSGTGGPVELYFDDIAVGTTFDLGVVDVDRDEMLAFARRYDPQWYHVDVEAARASAYGDVIASGFYTASLFMRAYADTVLSRAAADASPGLEELRWTAPVYGGDRLRISLDVLDAALSGTKPNVGTLTLTATMTRLANGDRPEAVAVRMRFRGWFARRPTRD